MTKLQFLDNNMFTSYTLLVDFPQTYEFDKNKQEVIESLEKIKAIYDKDKFINQNEHQFEDDFITKVLDILGWEYIRQEEKIIQGRIEKPDFLLFCNLDSKKEYEKIPRDDRYAKNTGISVILETKAYNVAVDNKKILNNPHFQLVSYLNNLRVFYGFSSNGHVWRFYDLNKISSNKVFYEVDLESILFCEDSNLQLEAFEYFYYVFHAKNFVPREVMQKDEVIIESKMKTSLRKNEEAKTMIEQDLQAVIYGTNGNESIFEKIGSCIYERNKEQGLQEAYNNSLYFTFRLLFIMFFEDRFNKILKGHRYFHDYMTLQRYILDFIESNKHEDDRFTAFNRLNDIFRIYNEGNGNIYMPAFNGGLFNNENAPLLKTSKMFDNKTLYNILFKLLNFNDGKSIFYRDYRTLSITHLGTIYEGLLAYFFNIAENDMVYISYEPKYKKSDEEINEEYADIYEYKDLQKDNIVHKVQDYKKGQLFLMNTSNTRKNTASFYTPESITRFLVEIGLQNNLSNENIAHFKILDNACGSGHFLIEALNQITQIVLENFEYFSNLHQYYNKERDAIQEIIKDFEIKDYVVDESDILKRLLLKRVIYGVDLSPFAIELSKLSLWINSFIFGTPLSFIEHHIKCGNALIGTNLQEIQDFYNLNQESQSGINKFIKIFTPLIRKLQARFIKLDSITDTTREQVMESKRIYTKEITPILNKLNLYFNYFTLKYFYNNQEKEIFDNVENKHILETSFNLDSNTNFFELFEMVLTEEDGYQKNELVKIIESYAKKYKFFNYAIEFPEILNIPRSKDRIQDFKDIKFVGFDIIVSNPPWDKVKFSDNDFFPQFKSNYRKLSNAKKEEYKINSLDKNYIKRQYDENKALIESNNEYYKSRYPLNEGIGDSNLFRFFVERNLSLLDSNATLNYVLPSALMLEESSVNLRKYILENKTLEYFYCFENRNITFRRVDSRYKFALMQIKNAKAPSYHRIKTLFYQVDVDDATDSHRAKDILDGKRVQKKHKPKREVNPNVLKNTFWEERVSKTEYMTKKELRVYARRLIYIDLDTIRLLSPNHLALMELSGKKDLVILKRLYKRFSGLDSKWLDFRNELHMTSDKDLFIESFSKDLLPLYQGKLIHQYNARFKDPFIEARKLHLYFLNKKDFDARMRSKEVYRLKQDLNIHIKEYNKILDFMLKKSSFKSIEQLEDSIIKYDREYFRLAFRGIASDTNERTSIFSLIPKNVGCGNTLYVSIPKVYTTRYKDIITKEIPHIRILFALGVFNSITFDFLLRRVVQISVNKTYLVRIPFPQKSDTLIESNTDYKQIAINALLLQLYNDKAGDFSELKTEFNIKDSDLPKTKKQYDILRAKTDHLVAKLYGISKDEFLYILESFKVLQDTQPQYISLLREMFEI